MHPGIFGSLAERWLAQRPWCANSDRPHGRGLSRPLLDGCHRISLNFAALFREQAYREAPRVGVPQAKISSRIAAGTASSAGVGSPALGRKKNRCRKRRKCQVRGSKSLVNQKPAAVTQQLVHFLKDSSHTLE